MTIQGLLGSKSADVFTIRATETVKSAAEQMPSMASAHWS